MPTISIDNLEIEVPAGTKVIDAAARLGIVIPRFCFHPALGSVGACRVCAVAFTDGPVKGIQMSCMVNALDGMVISTTDDEAVDFRRHVIEWLMMNHPHDCPVCDEGGHCLLQDTTVAGGHGLRRFQGLKRTHQDQYLGPLLQHEMNRCIQCYRCSRYYQEFAGYKDLGVMGIGSRVYFGRSRPGTLESPFAGNLIDICPTGVYTDKPSRFFGRRWDFERAPSVCLHCSLGCNLVVSARYRQVVRHEARLNDPVNGHFICDRGRFGYAYASAPDRPLIPMRNGEPTSMAEALATARQALAEGMKQNKTDSLAVIGSARSNLETLATLAYLTRDYKCQGPVVEYSPRRARNLKAAVQCLNAELAVSLGAISVADTVVVIGADPLNEAPMLTLSLRQAQRQGARITVIDPRAIKMALEFDHLAVHPMDLSRVVKQLIQKIDPQWKLNSSPSPDTDPSDETAPERQWDERLQPLAHRLLAAKRAVVICGTDITAVDEITWAAELARVLRAAKTEAKLFYLMAGPNAYTAGVLMDEILDVRKVVEQIEAGRIKSLLVVENDLWRQYPDQNRLMAALKRLEAFVLLDHVASPLVAEATAFIPTQTIYEAGGRWINQEGRLQMAAPVLKGGEPITITGGQGHPPREFGHEIPGGQPLPAWQALFELMGMEKHARSDPGQRLSAAMQHIRADLDITEESEDGARIELGERQCHIPVPTGDSVAGPADDRSKTLQLLLVDRVLGTEPLSAMSPALRESDPEPMAVVHPVDAKRLALADGGKIKIETETGTLTLTLATDSRMARGVVVIPRHHSLEWQVLGSTRMTLGPGQVRAA